MVYYIADYRGGNIKDIVPNAVETDGRYIIEINDLEKFFTELAQGRQNMRFMVCPPNTYRFQGNQWFIWVSPFGGFAQM